MEELSRAAQNELEVAGVLFVRVLDAADGSRRLLGRGLRWVPQEEYIEQQSFGLVIAPTGYISALAEAEQNGDTAIWFHTHPGLDGIPCPSSHDHEVDRQIADLFRIRTGSAYYGTLIFSPRSRGLPSLALFILQMTTWSPSIAFGSSGIVGDLFHPSTPTAPISPLCLSAISVPSGRICNSHCENFTLQSWDAVVQDLQSLNS
jgi:proteasome lid subunit RPN8/RPN11